LIRSRIRTLIQILHKEVELAYIMLLTANRIKDQQMKELLAANFNKHLAQMDVTWQALTMQIAHLKVHG
jgi:hypothetical protein